MTDPVRLDVHGEVLVVTLDRPKANAIDVATSRALYGAFERLRDDPALRVGVVTGAGERFF
jgi:crotonobetainyl-CoA hydratase